MWGGGLVPESIVTYTFICMHVIIHKKKIWGERDKPVGIDY